MIGFSDRDQGQRARGQSERSGSGQGAYLDQLECHLGSHIHGLDEGLSRLLVLTLGEEGTAFG